MHLVNNILFFVLISFSHQLLLSQSSPFNTFVSQVVKDANTSLHIMPNYLIDLDAPFTWQGCIVQRHSDVVCGIIEGCLSPVSCDDDLCKEAQSYAPNPICPSLNITTKYGCQICAVTPFNPVSNTCKLSQLTTDWVWSFSVTNGRNPHIYPAAEIRLSCAPSSLLSTLPKGVQGVAAFSWSTLAFPRQLAYPDVADKFALCLPSSSSAPGVTFLGDGPFYFTPSPNLDIRTILSYTPMIRRSSKSLGYYIKLNRISINGTPVHLPSLKSESVKLSTVVAYTTLRSDIYKALVTSFSKATKTIPRVNVVKPFSLCLKSSAVGSVNKGFRVPKIDLETESGKVWTILGDNSMKRTGNGTACLAFIDGGSRVKDAIVIGTFQMENNFLYFDLENEELGFSSSLLARGITCSSFNSTYVEEK
ncbi:hypothetical protein SSX86_005290 [Deinandra increscens subsp. villosa]|uniref:Peptidase A1 domain-containing protein n=1 Tax=Deinandra increscens subsp. villosa TaxID=3103831 RepID=A0AAP0DPK3_9ASTR